VKRSRARKTIGKFLDEIPSEVDYLKAFFSYAHNMLGHSLLNEKELECIEEKIEAILIKNARDIERNEVRKEVEREFGLDEENFEDIFKIKLLKFLRSKYKIPFVSLFYY
jgi:hypothetical protein